MSKRKPEVEVFELSEPIELTNTTGDVIRTIEKVTLNKKVRTKHLKGVKLTDENVSFDSLVRLVANLSGLSDIEVGEIVFDDIQELVGIAAGFLAGQEIGPQTGTTSSEQ